MTINPERVIPAACHSLAPGDFTVRELGGAFQLLARLFQSGVAVDDPRIVIRELQAAGSGIALNVVKRAQDIPNIGTFQWHIDRVRNLSRLRAILYTFDQRIKDEITAPKAQADDVLAWIEAQTLKLRQGMTSNFRSIGEVMDEVLADYQARVGKPEPLVLLSGFPSVDQCGFVFGAGELAILAARPGIGKTSLATQIAMHHANKGRTVLLASLEMKDRALVSRVLVSSAGQNHQLIRTQAIEQWQVDEMRQARERIGAPPFYVWSPGRVKAGMIHAAAAVLKAQHDLRLLIVDYLGLVRPDDAGRPRHEQVGEVVKALRDIGGQLEIPVLCLCQLNREADGVEPKLSNLRESGDIEQDADCVAFLHVPNQDFPEQVLLKVDKGRQGSKGSTILEFNPVHTKFEQPSYEWTPDNSRHER
jgi:replicative DNA helicase